MVMLSMFVEKQPVYEFFVTGCCAAHFLAV